MTFGGAGTSRNTLGGGQLQPWGGCLRLMDPDTDSGMGQSEPPGAEPAGWLARTFSHLDNDARAARISHVDVDGDWGEGTPPPGLRMMTVMCNSHLEGSWHCPEVLPPPPGYCALLWKKQLREWKRGHAANRRWSLLGEYEG